MSVTAVPMKMQARRSAHVEHVICLRASPASKCRSGCVGHRQSAIPAAGIARAADPLQFNDRSVASGCPSIDPHLRYGVVALHQGCAQLDRRFFFDRQLETQSPAAGRGIRLGDDVPDLGLLRGHVAADAVRDRPISACRRPGREQIFWCPRPCARRPSAKIAPATWASAYRVPNAADRCRYARPWPAGGSSAAKSRRCCRGFLPWSEFRSS